MTVRDAVADDAAAIAAIQNALLDSTAIEWTDVPHTIDGRREWIARHQAAGEAVVVAEVDGEVVGFGAWGDFRDSTRWPGYRVVAEHTIHVRESHWGAGVGRLLLDALVDSARRAGKHVLVAAIDGDNDASIRFHERLGFVEVARMPEVGTKHGRWLDLVLLQLRLDDGPAPPTS